MLNIFDTLHVLDLIGTVVFAMTGLLAASRKQLDLFGAIIIAMVASVGGGTLRDIILDQPVFWLYEPLYIYLIIGSTIVLFIYARFKEAPIKLLVFLDAVGLATFTVLGANKALVLGFSDPIVIMTGVMTGVVGGVIRDILVGEVPLIFRKEIYATAAFLGGSLMLLLIDVGLSKELSIFIAMLVVLFVRLLAIVYNIKLPVFNPIHH